jgi:hypothetical protein
MASSYTLTPKSYTIIVRQGKKHLLKEELKDYEVAMERLDELERVYGNKYFIDFRTNF